MFLFQDLTWDLLVKQTKLQKYGETSHPSPHPTQTSVRLIFLNPLRPSVLFGMDQQNCMLHGYSILGKHPRQNDIYILGMEFSKPNMAFLASINLRVVRIVIVEFIKCCKKIFCLESTKGNPIRQLGRQTCKRYWTLKNLLTWPFLFQKIHSRRKENFFHKSMGRIFFTFTCQKHFTILNREEKMSNLVIGVIGIAC